MSSVIELESIDFFISPSSWASITTGSITSSKLLNDCSVILATLLFRDPTSDIILFIIQPAKF